MITFAQAEEAASVAREAIRYSPELGIFALAFLVLVIGCFVMMGRQANTSVSHNKSIAKDFLEHNKSMSEGFRETLLRFHESQKELSAEVRELRIKIEKIK